MRNFLPNTILSLATSINAIKSDTRRPYATADIGELRLKCLFDTGADVSCIKTATFAQSQLTNLPYKKHNFNNFRAAGGQKLQISGQVELPISIDNKMVHHPFFLIDNLNEDCILGIDFITNHSLSYNPQSRQFSWPGEKAWVNGIISMAQSDIIPALGTKVVKVNVITDNNTTPTHSTIISACVGSETKPLLTSTPGLASVDQKGQINVLIKNCAPVDIKLDKSEIIGRSENINDCEFTQLNPLAFKTMEDIASVQTKKPISKEVEKFIQSNSKLSVPDCEKDKYLKLLCEHWETFSLDKHDLGLCKLLQHDIELKTKEPIYVKQFKIPEAHMSEVKNQLTEWLKLGVVEPCRSKYNSPIFVVAKKDGGLRIVQDFRALNSETYVDKYSMQDVNECVAEIGRSGSTIFSTLDLTSGFWQMQLHPEAKKTTAFTIPGFGQFCWKVAPMGLLGSPASFQRLVETVLKGIPNVIVYIDDLIIHTSTHRQHRETLRLVFDRLRANNLKVNLKKCEFGSQSVSYLGFRLTPEGIKPGMDKLKAVGQTSPPASVKEVRQFLGLCNFFRGHVKNFALITHPLTKLTCKESPWKRGPLPPEALKAFRELQSILCSEPVIDYPRKNRSYVLITDASFGDDKTPGGLGAILTQVDDKGEHRVIAYASRKLAKHEKNYTPFLLEMQAALWAMDHFHVYLKGHHFTLMTDHKPLETMGTIHTKTLNRLQEAMNTIYSFNIVYKKGAEMPADFLSRQAIDSISWENNSLKQAQQNDPMLQAIINFLYNRILPTTSVLQGLVKMYANDCFMENGLLWRRLKRQGDSAHVVLFVPESMKSDILAEAHGGQFTGHDGIFKTKERVLQCYYWPGMDKDINDFIKMCVTCQKRAKSGQNSNTFLQPLPQCSAPNQRVHADLFGPLKTSGSGKKYILCLTDAMTKYVELVALPDKEAQTVAEATFNRWICRYGSPLQLTTDGGKEFCSKLSDQLYKLMKIDHLTTSPYHPQCNSQAEIVNKTIAKYLSSFVDESTLDWEIYLPPLMFAYNTSMHSTTKFSPFFLTFGQKPRAPHFPSPDISRVFYGESTIDEMWLRLQQARKVAIANNEQVRDDYEQNFNQKVAPVNYTVGQQVFLDEHNFLNKNRKLAPKFSGPHVIEKLLHGTNAQIKLKNGRSTIVHLNRLKPFLSSDDQIVERKEDEKERENNQLVNFDVDETPPPFETFCRNPRNLLPNLPTHPPPQQFPEAPKRGRGRPKKSQVTPPREESARDEGVSIPSDAEKVTSPPVQFQMKTRSQIQQLSEAEKADYFAVNFIETIKNLVKNKKKLKNGSRNASWTTQQKRAFRLYGDIYGRTVKGHESVVDRGDQNPVVPPEPQDQDQHQDLDEFFDLEDFFNLEDGEHEDDQEGGYATPEESEEEDPEGQEDAPNPAGAMLPLPHQQLPVIPGPQQPQQQGKGKDNPKQADEPPPPAQLPRPLEMPPGAQHAAQDPLPSPPVQPRSPHHHKADASGKAKIVQPSPAENPFFGLFKNPEPEKAKRDTDPKTAKETETPPKTATPKPRRFWADFKSPDNPNQQPSSVGLMAELIGLSPTQITKKARTELVGNLVKQAISPPVPPVARKRFQGDLEGGHHDLGRPDSTHSSQTSDSTPPTEGAQGTTSPPSKKPTDRRKQLDDTIADLQKRLDDVKTQAQAQAQPRPTRSTYKAPDIPPLPSVPLERLLKKQLKQKQDKQTQKDSSDSEID